MLRIRQFAKIANVTVRTLYHYDRLGLLSPTLRSASGDRLYRMEDLGQLERLLVLRYLGIPLRQIAELLATGGTGPGKGLTPTLPDTLARQTTVLRERRDGIDRVLLAIARARRQLETDPKPDWLLYEIILKEIHMQESQDWTKKYYSPEAQQAIEDRQPRRSPELQERITTDWQEMYADVQLAMDQCISPTSAQGKTLAARWMKLVEAFTGGNRAVLEGLNKLYADRPNWPAGETDPEMHRNLPKLELMAFVRAAQED